MSTNTEKYLKENRQLLDVEYPDDKAIWGKISSAKMEGKAGKKLIFRPLFHSQIARIAASIMLMLGLTYMIADLTFGLPFSRDNYLSEISSEYAGIEEDYMHAVKMKEKDVRRVDIPDNDLTRSISFELEQLDELYRITIKDLRELGDNEKVVNIIFDIYERKIELLERIILETNKAENYEKDMERNI